MLLVQAKDTGTERKKRERERERTDRRRDLLFI